MSDIQDVQRILMGKAERIYREYRDADNALVNPTYPLVSVYNPVGTFVSSAESTQESIGVYYYTITVSSATANKEGIYQAHWEGTIGGALITQDEPQYINVTRVPWQITEPQAIINSVRRITGDNNPDRYVISTREMYYFLKDAVDEVQAEYNFGYVLTVTATSLSWNTALRSTPFVMFKMRCLILVLESKMHDCFYDTGSVTVGDVKIDLVPTMKMRREVLKDLREEYKRMMHEVKMNTFGGLVIDTYKTGLLANDSDFDSLISYESYGA